jgi:threonine/homoserine efflux transporter RhtA
MSMTESSIEGARQGERSTTSKSVWVGRILAVLVSLPFVISSVMKLIRHPEVIKGMTHLGLPESILLPLGVIELLCVVLYLIPQTAFFGAILLTGYVGGTIITHWRMGEPMYVQILFGVLAWIGLYLRRPRLREVVWSV